MKKMWTVFGIQLVVVLSLHFCIPQHEYQTGDIIFQSSTSGQSLAVQIATKSKFSHVGMIVKIDGRTMVLEAVQPVKLTAFETWIGAGDDEYFVVKRLKDTEILTKSKKEALINYGKTFLNKDYDPYFEWSDDRIYCSELVWKVYDKVLGLQVGELEKLGDFDLSHPEVQKIVKQRYGNNIPKRETVVSPDAIFRSPLLVTVP